MNRQIHDQDLSPALAGTRADSGLTASQAAARLAREGPNLLPQAERRRFWQVLVKVLREPMLLLLLFAAAVYLLLGDASEAMILGASVLLVIGLTLYQEQKSENAMQALRDLSSPRAQVVRDGKPMMIAASDVVIGDTILVTEGDRLPADARVLEEVDLHVDESLLPGSQNHPNAPRPTQHAQIRQRRGQAAAPLVGILVETISVSG